MAIFCWIQQYSYLMNMNIRRPIVRNRMAIPVWVCNCFFWISIIFGSFWLLVDMICMASFMVLPVFMFNKVQNNSTIIKGDIIWIKFILRSPVNIFFICKGIQMNLSINITLKGCLCREQFIILYILLFLNTFSVNSLKKYLTNIITHNIAINLKKSEKTIAKLISFIYVPNNISNTLTGNP